MNVSVVIPTRGDVDLTPILDSLPIEWEVIVYDNGQGSVSRRVMQHTLARIVTGKGELPDLAVYARYAAIEYATHEVILTQDDDCIVSDPQAIVRALCTDPPIGLGGREDVVVCNMPQKYRHSFYVDHALVGFGACFHRDAPAQAFQRMTDVIPTLGLSNYGWWLPGFPGNDHFNNTCDVAFTALTTRVLVDVPKTDREFASDPGRMWTTLGHQEERSMMLDLVRKVRDA